MQLPDLRPIDLGDHLPGERRALTEPSPEPARVSVASAAYQVIAAELADLITRTTVLGDTGAAQRSSNKLTMRTLRGDHSICRAPRDGELHFPAALPLGAYAARR